MIVPGEHIPGTAYNVSPFSFITSTLSSLNDDWHILEQTAKKIKLEDVSGGNGGTDYLTFEQ